MVGALILLGAYGCSGVLGIQADRYLVTDAGSGAEAGPVDAGADAPLEPVEAGPWGCLGQPVDPVNPAAQVDLTVLLFDPLQNSTAAGSVDGGSDLVTTSYTPLTGVSIRYCSVRDPSCNNPSPWVVSDSAGLSEFHVPGDFAGFFEFQRSDLLPASFYPGRLLDKETPITFPSYDFSADGLQVLASTVTTSAIATDPDGGLGHAFITMYDCQDHQAAGVSLTIDNSTPETVVFYTVGGLPTSKTMQTDNYGLAGAVNVPVGSLTVNATLAATLTPIGSINVIIRPGAITFGWVRVRTL